MYLDTSGRNTVFIKDLKAALTSYGDKFDEKEFDLFEKTLNTGLSRKNIAEGKFNVDGMLKFIVGLFKKVFKK